MGTHHGLTKVLATLVLGLSGVFASAGTTFAHAGPLEGVWGVIVTIRDCTTGAPLGPPIRELVTYHLGGTVSHSSAGAVVVNARRSEGHGTWSQADAATYTERIVAMFPFDSPEFRAGWGITTTTITLTGPSSYTGTGTAQFYDLSRQVYRSGCATRVGERFR